MPQSCNGVCGHVAVDRVTCVGRNSLIERDVPVLAIACEAQSSCGWLFG